MHILGTILLLAGLSTCCYAQQEPIEDFFPIADSVSSFPPVTEHLVVLCQKKVGQYHVSFVGTAKEAKVFIAVVTLEPFTEPDSIALTVTYNGYHPGTGKYPTWGYVFDRNEDGKIDYLALLSGAAAFKGADFPEQYPKRNEYFTKEQLEYFIGHCKLIFNHYADDNDDGFIDAVIHVDMDTTRDWVERRILARSKAFNRTFDDAWGFYERTDEEPHQLSFTGESVPFHSLTKRHDALTWKLLDEKSGILQLMNRAAEECKLTGAKFVHPEKTE